MPDARAEVPPCDCPSDEFGVRRHPSDCPTVAWIALVETTERAWTAGFHAADRAVSDEPTTLADVPIGPDRDSR